MQTPQPPGTPPYEAPVGQEAPYQVAGAGPAPGRPRTGWWLAAGAVALAFLLGGFLVGTIVEKNRYEAGKPAYDAIYNVGYSAGQGEGTSVGEKTGRKEGRKVGKAIGFQRGKNVGRRQGEIKGTADGATAALGGLTGWDPDSNYIVKVSPGPSSEVPYVVSARSEMVRGRYYELCRRNPQQVCSTSR